jgi:trehalose 6-phosphate phosphatase
VTQSLHDDPEVKSRVAAADRLLLFLDFDGTLTPIVNNPSRVRLDNRTREALDSLATEKNVDIAIMSGRSMDDLRARVGIDSLTYGANHGLEIRGPDIRFVSKSALHARRDLRSLLACLNPLIRKVRGAWMEAKGLSLSIHYRLCAEKDAAELRDFVSDAIRPLAGRLRLAEGKKVFEVLPNTSWNKGAAANWILMRPENYAALVFCFGDDRTDEDLFRAFPDAITVKVGDGTSTAAKYRVDSPAEVREFLVWLGHNAPEYPVAA